MLHRHATPHSIRIKPLTEHSNLILLAQEVAGKQRLVRDSDIPRVVELLRQLQELDIADRYRGDSQAELVRAGLRCAFCCFISSMVTHAGRRAARSGSALGASRSSRSASCKNGACRCERAAAAGAELALLEVLSHVLQEEMKRKKEEEVSVEFLSEVRVLRCVASLWLLLTGGCGGGGGEQYMDKLYDDSLEEKVAGTGCILQLVRNVANLEELVNNGALRGCGAAEAVCSLTPVGARQRHSLVRWHEC